MCCELCPQYEDCLEINELNPDCCPECPDYEKCIEESEDEEED